MVVSGFGCMLPFLILFNLLFGWLFLSFTSWFIVEALLILLFMFSAVITARRMNSASRHDEAIDVQAHVLDDKDKIEDKQ